MVGVYAILFYFCFVKGRASPWPLIYDITGVAISKILLSLGTRIAGFSKAIMLSHGVPGFIVSGCHNFIFHDVNITVDGFEKRAAFHGGVNPLAVELEKEFAQQSHTLREIWSSIRLSLASSSSVEIINR